VASPVLYRIELVLLAVAVVIAIVAIVAVITSPR
jgi:hypothetical protein